MPKGEFNLDIPMKAFTHGGRFHADDVFSTALLQIINPAMTVERGFTVPEHFDGIVYDIGDGAFDHHQKGSLVRENGVAYAAFGILWRAVGAELLGDLREAARFDEYFVQPLDLDDNTGCGNQLANVIGAYNPRWDSEDLPDACFAEAVAVAKDLLQHKLDGIQSVLRAASEVNAALREMRGGIVHLSRFAPWKQQLIPSKAKFVVHPSQRGGWSAQGIPRAFGTAELKVPFPAEWAGVSAAELPAISGIDGLRFCHANRFLVTTATEEEAVRACEDAVDAQKNG